MTSTHVFGPVPSRRLGRSLGVDLVPFKTCSYDCIYCQLGRTTELTVDRRDWVPVDAVVAELKDTLERSRDRPPDYITLSGSGEPTLHARIGDVIAGIRARTDIPVAVLTNGSLLWQEAVREQLRDASLVVPSLDAGDAAMFAAVNRPHPDIDFDRMVDGLIAFRAAYAGEIWLEIMLLAGHTAIDSEVRKIANLAKRVRPDRVQLNTPDRPTAESFAGSTLHDRLDQLGCLFTPPADPIERKETQDMNTAMASERAAIVDLLRRRPCTAQDVSVALGAHLTAVIKDLHGLFLEGRVVRRRAGKRTYYCIAEHDR